METISVSRTIRTSWNTADYPEIARHILGKNYSLSIVLISDAKAKKLNEMYRKKTYAANVLTFPLRDHAAEIFLNISRIKREAHTFNLTPIQHAKFLLIHGCLHLKGYTHGGTMEQAEKYLLKKFTIVR